MQQEYFFLQHYASSKPRTSPHSTSPKSPLRLVLITTCTQAAKRHYSSTQAEGGPACQNTVFQSPKDTRNGSDQIPSCQAPASTSRRRRVFSARRMAHQSLSSTLVFRCGLQLLSGLTWTALLPLSLLMLFSHYSCIDDLICINSIWFAQQQQKSKRRLVAQRLEKHQGRTKQTGRRQHQAKREFKQDPRKPARSTPQAPGTRETGTTAGHGN